MPEIADTQDETMKITDLNDDCLEHIFDYLSLEDLLNVAFSNTALQYASGLLFKRKYGVLHFKFFRIADSLMWQIGGELFVNEIEAQRFFLVFADFISSISLIFHEEYEEIFEKRLQQISTYSLESLIEIKLCHFPEGWLNKFSKPMPKIKSVVLDDCHLGGKSVMLSHIFPKLCNLKICDSSTEIDQIISHFPYLKMLDLNVDNNSSKFESFLNLNPQLTSFKLKLKGSRDWNLVRCIAEKLQLENFYFRYSRSLPQNERFHFKKVRTFEYHSDGNFPPFTFDQLEELKQDDHMQPLGINQMDKIVGQNSKLRKVTLSNIDDVNSMNMSKELRRISKLTLNMFRWIDINVDAIVDFINEKTFASIIKFKFIDETFTTDLQNKIDKTKWIANFNKSKRFYIAELTRK